MCGVRTRLGTSQQRGIDLRLVLEHIQRGATNLAGVECIDQWDSSTTPPRAVLIT